jgi:hypothetical protein
MFSFPEALPHSTNTAQKRKGTETANRLPEAGCVSSIAERIKQHKTASTAVTTTNIRPCLDWNFKQQMQNNTHKCPLKSTAAVCISHSQQLNADSLPTSQATPLHRAVNCCLLWLHGARAQISAPALSNATL